MKPDDWELTRCELCGDVLKIPMELKNGLCKSCQIDLSIETEYPLQESIYNGKYWE